METASRKIDYKDVLTIIPFSDLHLGSRSCAEGKIDRLFKRIVDTPDCYAIGLGDYADLVIKNDIKRFMGSCTKDELLNCLDSAVNEQRNLVVRKLQPLADAGKLIGLLEGNHEESIKKHHSFDIMQDICERLKVPNLGYSCFFNLVLSKKGNRRGVVTIYAHHGFGWSKKVGSAMNRREDLMGKYDADLILLGHDHFCGGTRLVRLYATTADKPKIKEKPVIIAATGTYHKTAIQGYTSYSERAGYPPQPLGSVEITIDYTGHENDLEMHIKE